MNIREISKFVVERGGFITAIDHEDKTIDYSVIKGESLTRPEDLQWVCDALNAKLKEEKQNNPPDITLVK